MAARKLTDTILTALKPDGGKRAEEWDTMVPGLHVRANLDGSKVWFLRYRLKDGTQRRQKLGRYGDLGLGLAAARKAGRAALEVVAAGGDPAANAKREAAEAKAAPIKTVDDLMTAYFQAVREGTWRPRGQPKADSTIKGDEGVYKRHMQRMLGAERVEAVDARMLKSMLRAIKQRAGLQTNKAWSCGSQAFSYAQKELHLVQVNPFSLVPKLMPPTKRERLLTDAEIRAAVMAIRDPSALRLGDEEERVYIGEMNAMALELCFRLGQRRTEVCEMERGELRLDQAEWTIRSARTKSKVRPHLVPLPPGAVDLIRRAMAATDDMRRRQGREPSAYVFCTPRLMKSKAKAGEKPVTDKPLGGSALTHGVGDAYAALGVADATLHDWRTTMTTNLASPRGGSFSQFHLGKLLSHSVREGAKVTGIYNLYEYQAEKRAALKAWERLFCSIVEGDSAASAAA